MLQEIERQPYIPLRLHLSSGKLIDIKDAGSAFVQQNTLLLMHRLVPGSQAIGNYDVIALRLIERIKQLKIPPAWKDVAVIPTSKRRRMSASEIARIRAAQKNVGQNGGNNKR